MSERYFCAEPIQTERVQLTGPEAHHLLHVMRAPVGTRVVLFDGSGWEFEAELVRAAHQEAEFLVRHRAYVDRELPVLLLLGVAMPKGDRQKWLVEKAVELGVGRLVPLITTRSVVQPGPGMLQRLRRTVIEASKQCGRNHLMHIDLPIQAGEWFSACAQAKLRWLAHPPRPACSEEPGLSKSAALLKIAAAQMPEVPLREEHSGQMKPLWAVAVGPEGGWTESELAAAQSAGWQLVSLGPRILRTETAALTLAALLSHRATVAFPPASAVS